MLSRAESRKPRRAGGGRSFDVDRPQERLQRAVGVQHETTIGGEQMRRSNRVVPAGEVTWDDTYDVVVVGAGAAGFPSALHAARRGSSAVILEKAAEPGGTMKKSAAWYWIPNNSDMQ